VARLDDKRQIGVALRGVYISVNLLTFGPSGILKFEGLSGPKTEIRLWYDCNLFKTTISNIYMY